MKKKYPVEQTKCVDDCICPYCGYKFDGRTAINNDLDVRIIECPKCNKDIEVYPSVEYICSIIKD